MSRRPASPARRPRAADDARPQARPVTGAAPRGGRRPGPRARNQTSGESRPVRVARLLSVRALVLGVVGLAGFALLFPTVRAYLGQQAELDALAAEVTAAEQQEESLRNELDRWQDPAYVAAQARERLGYVMPGETSYLVIDPEVVVEEPTDGEASAPTTGPTLPVGGAVNPWYTTVWDSVQAAGEAEVPAEEGAAEVPVPVVGGEG